MTDNLPAIDPREVQMVYLASSLPRFTGYAVMWAEHETNEGLAGLPARPEGDDATALHRWHRDVWAYLDERHLLEGYREHVRRHAVVPFCPWWCTGRHPEISWDEGIEAAEVHERQLDIAALPVSGLVVEVLYEWCDADPAPAQVAVSVGGNRNQTLDRFAPDDVVALGEAIARGGRAAAKLATLEAERMSVSG